MFSAIRAHAAGHTGNTDFSDGSILGYLEYLPTNYDSTTEDYPLIIYLHGAGGRSTTGVVNFSLMENEGLAGYLQDHDVPFMVICPQVRFTWNGTADNLDAFLDFLLLKYDRIDPTRVFITGISDGGKGVFDFPLHYRGRLAGIIPVSTWPSDAQSNVIATEPFSDDPPLPIWGFHGQSDTYYSMESWLTEVASEGGEVQFTLLPGGHTAGVWDRVYDGETFSFQGTDYTIYEWMLTLSNQDALNYVPEDPTTIKPAVSLSGKRRLAYEGFDLPAGEVDGASGATAVGWKASWSSAEDSVVESGLGFTGLSSVGGALSLSAASDGLEVAAVREFPFSVEGSGVAWFSVLVQVPSTGGESGAAFHLALRNNRANPLELWVGIPDGSSEWAIGGTAIDANEGSELVSTGIAVVADTPVWLTLLLDLGTDEGMLWIDADPGMAEPNEATATKFALESQFSFERVQISYQNATEFAGTLIDEIKLGTSFSSVATKLWGDWPVVSDLFVDTTGSRNDLGWLYLGADPWVYSYKLETWIYLPSQLQWESGMWGYTRKK